eukprot:scaffold733_cov267-Pinguiococcus_pyrenoidosus.AAC.28
MQPLRHPKQPEDCQKAHLQRQGRGGLPLRGALGQPCLEGCKSLACNRGAHEPHEQPIEEHIWHQGWRGLERPSSELRPPLSGRDQRRSRLAKLKLRDSGGGSGRKLARQPREGGGDSEYRQDGQKPEHPKQHREDLGVSSPPRVTN